MITIHLYDKTNQELTISFRDRPKQYIYKGVSEYQFRQIQKAIKNKNNSEIQRILKAVAENDEE